LPNLLTDIKSIVDTQSQIDPTMKSERLYTRLSAAEVRRQLMVKFEYAEEELPTIETIRIKLNQLGYHPQKVALGKPQKKIPETDAIFEQMERVTLEAALDPTTLQISMDAKALVNIGPFSRGGKNRVSTTACDHDFTPKTRVTPYGILLPEFDDLFLYFTESKVTSEFIVNILEEWWEEFSERFKNYQTLLLKLDNGPENNSRRTQFMKRIVEFVDKYQVNVRLAYYPPYHSKYNPIERTWAVLENHWNGTILEDIQTALKFAQTMTWKGNHPMVKLMNQSYETGVKLTKKAMDEIETQIERLSNQESQALPNLGPWFVDICYRSAY
ncbi:MAG: ISAzo13 family transposase, partial [Okeania sp. SIO2H7]|nr:ISAzo13 family transposase [Okeania sp. SIO2H7]